MRFYFLVVLFFCIGCGSRKVKTELNKTSDKSKFEETSRKVSVSSVLKADNTKVALAVLDTSIHTVNASLVLEADEITYHLNGDITAKGKAKAFGQKKLDSHKHYSSNLSIDKSENSLQSEEKDSSGSKKTEKNLRGKEKLKEVLTKAPFGWPVAAVLGILFVSFLLLKSGLVKKFI